MASDTYNNRKQETDSDLPESARLARPAEFGGTRLILMHSDPEGWAVAMREMVRVQPPKPETTQLPTQPETVTIIHNMADYQHQPAPSIMTLPEDGPVAQDENLIQAQQLVKEALDEAA